jgi:hypothetical protein
MAQYLVIAHQTIARRELLDRLVAIAAQDQTAWFTLLVPATHPEHLLVWEAGTAREIAERRVEEAKGVFRDAKLHLTRASVGDSAPMRALREELEDHPSTYASVILCTLPPGVSKWLGLNVLDEVAYLLNVPVEHIVAGEAYDDLLETVRDR